VAIAISFQPTGGGKAAITGDFVLTNDEVNPVIRALRANGIDVTAVHSHMLDEQPRLFFLHFRAVDDALKLAKGLRAALDKTASTKSYWAFPFQNRGEVIMRIFAATLLVFAGFFAPRPSARAQSSCKVGADQQ
jgi:Domain of Unknown Function (DUF1259)